MRAISRLRAILLEYFPALGRAFDYSKGKGTLTLLSGDPGASQLRRLDAARLAAWLKKRGSMYSIMHTVVVGGELTEEHPGLKWAIYAGFELSAKTTHEECERDREAENLTSSIPWMT